MTRAAVFREAVHWAVVVAATGVPWVVGWGVHWWVGLLAWGAGCWMYDRLFVPPGVMCSGIPFMLPLGSGLAYLGWGVLLLAGWLCGFAG